MTKEQLDKLHNDYSNAVKAYIEAFEAKHEVSIEFDPKRLEYFEFASVSASLSEIMYDLHVNAPNSSIFQYFDYCYDVWDKRNNGENVELMNYPHWLRLEKGIKIIDY